ncbi:STAS domain-containing protein [Streptomyces sp. NPDC058739]|uniref:STAS domain-containing protein n=1 Tax=Streptomyces sp. NPDC058739 TaxID=3346618 RepID=UPI003678D50B
MSRHVPGQPSPPSITRHTVGGIAVVTLRGEIDYSSRDQLHEHLLSRDTAQAPRTVVDFTLVTFIDSTTVNALVAAHRAAVRAHGWLRLAGLRPSARRVVEITGLSTFISCYQDLRQALNG